MRIIYLRTLHEERRRFVGAIGSDVMVKWQARSRARRLSGMKITLPALAVIGAGALLADVLGGFDLTGAAAFLPLALALPWVAQTVVGMVRSSLDGALG